MHFQIRKKEKYLLFSMVFYLLIVSSALFLIFSPVQGFQCTTGETVHCDFLGTMYQNDALNHVMTHAQIDAACTASGIGTMPVGENYPSWTTIKADNGIGANSGYIGSCTHPSDCTWNGYTFSGTAYTRDVGGRIEIRIDCTGASDFAYGYYNLSGGSPVPVINSVTLEEAQGCLQPNESVALIADVTGTVTTWMWQILDSGNNIVSNTSDPVQTVTDRLQAVGNYTVRLTVINSAGSDSMDNTTAIRVNQPGQCNFTPYNPFPTITVTPTQNVFVTMTMPPSVVVNISGVNDIIDNSYLGNMSAGYRSYVDQIGEGFNTTLVGVVSVVQSPLTMVINGIAEGVSLFSVSVNSLMSYTTIPLAIVGITLSYYPWQIITLITAGIAIDAAFVLIFGVR